MVIRFLLIATLVFAWSGLPAVAADRNANGLDDDAEVPVPHQPATSGEIAVVDTGDSSVGSFVSRLTGLGFGVTTIPLNSGIGTMMNYLIVILPVGHAGPATYTNFDNLSADYIAYVNSGRSLWVCQPNPFGMPGNEADITWVPYDLQVNVFYNTADCPSTVVNDVHCITENSAGINFSLAGDTVLSMGPEWNVLAEGSVTGYPAVMVATHGSGQVLVEFGHPSTGALCSPSDTALYRYAICLQQNPIGIDSESWAGTKARYR